jgi:DNA-binding CsgD family transcriptional regulator
MFTPQTTFEAVCAALRAGRSVLVLGTWGSGKTELLKRLNELVASGPIPSPSQPAQPNVGFPKFVSFDDVHRCSEDQIAKIARRISSGLQSVVSIRMGAEYPAHLHRSFQDCDVLVVRLGPLETCEIDEFCASLGFELSPPELLELDNRSGGIPLVIRALLEFDFNTTSFRNYAFDLAAVAAGVRAELDPPVRRIFDALSIAGKLTDAVADLLFQTEALDFGKTIGIFKSVQTQEGIGIEIAAPALAEASRNLLGEAPQKLLLGEILEASKQLDPPEPSFAYRIKRAQWSAQVNGDLELIRNGMNAAIINADFKAATQLGRHILRRDRTDLATAHSLSIAYEALGDHPSAAEINRLVLPTSDASWRMRNATDRYLAHPGSSIPGPDESFGNDPLSEAVAHRSWLHLFSGAVIAADEDATKVLTRAESSPQAIVWAALAQAGARVTLGAGPNSLSALVYAQDFVERPGVNPFASIQLGLTRALVQIRSGEATTAYREASTAAKSIAHVPILASGWHGFAAMAAREIGDYSLSLDHFEKSLAVQTGDPFGLGTLTQSEVAACQAMLRTSYTRTNRGAEPVGLFAPLTLRNEAWCAAADGDTEGAQQQALKAADLSAAQSQLTHEILALVDLARFGRTDEALGRIRLIQNFENPVIRIGAQAISAMADHRTDGLYRATRAARSIRWGALQDELAILTIELFRRRRDLSKAAQLEMAWMPTRWPTPICANAEPSVLTVRETQLGSLASEGRSTPEIAKVLEISPRTVDNLLGRLYLKCGVSGRIELAEIVREESGNSMFEFPTIKALPSANKATRLATELGPNTNAIQSIRSTKP